VGFTDRALGRGERGPDLHIWAHDRGLEFLHEADHLEGITLGLGGILESNVCIGKLDGKEMGVVFHESDQVQGPQGQQRWVERTRVAVGVPEAVAPLQALVISNGPDMGTVADGFRPTPEWGRLDPQSIGLGTRTRSGGVAGLLGFAPRWQVAVALGADTEMLTKLMQGALGEALETYDGKCGLDYRFGTLTFTHDDAMLGPSSELENAIQLTCLAARELRAAALENAQRQPWDAVLPEPAWVDAPPPEPPQEKGWGPFKVAQAQSLGIPMKERFDPFARGAPYEDPAAFHAAFPANPAPGVAWVVWRKEREGRTVRLSVNHGGACVALIEVNASAEDRPTPITAEPGTLGVAVRSGILAAWMYRDDSNFTPDLIDLVENQAFEVASQQGWL
jgi:hypothetical protein